MTLVQNALEEYQEEGRKLYDWLFLEHRTINRREDADAYLGKLQRYEFIRDMFQKMQMFGWLTGDVEIRD